MFPRSLLGQNVLMLLMDFAFGWIRYIWWQLHESVLLCWLLFKGFSLAGAQFRLSSQPRAFQVVGRFKLPVGMSDPCQFMLKHVAFLSRPSVQAWLSDPGAELWCLTASHAVFVRPKKGDVGGGVQSPFLFEEQFTRAQEVLMVPLSDLEALALSMGPLTANVCFIHNTTRCGSMALCQLFAQAPRTQVLQEPDALTSVLFRYWGGDSELKPLLKAVLRLLCRNADGVDLFVIKPRGHCIVLMPLLHEVYPNARHVFLYRDGQATVDSMVKTFGSEPIDLLRRHYLCTPLVQRWFPRQAKPLQMIFAISNKPELAWTRDWDFFAPLPLDVKYSMLWAGIVREYLDARHHVPVRALRYEDLVRGPDSVIREMLLHAGLKDTSVETVLAGRAAVLSVDQHRGSIFNAQRLSKCELRSTHHNRAAISAMCARFGVPDLTSSQVCEKSSLALPGTFGDSEQLG